MDVPEREWLTAKRVDGRIAGRWALSRHGMASISPRLLVRQGRHWNAPTAISSRSCVTAARVLPAREDRRLASGLGVDLVTWSCWFTKVRPRIGIRLHRHVDRPRTSTAPGHAAGGRGRVLGRHGAVRDAAPGRLPARRKPDSGRPCARRLLVYLSVGEDRGVAKRRNVGCLDKQRCRARGW
jgi:hypothetical protein